MEKRGLMIWGVTMGILASFITAHAHGEKQSPVAVAAHFRKMKAFEASLVQRDSVAPVSSSSLVAPSPSQAESNPRVYHVTSYGADPTGKTDSTDALLEAMSAAFRGPTQGFLMEGIANLGGPRIDLPYVDRHLRVFYLGNHLMFQSLWKCRARGILSSNSSEVVFNTTIYEDSDGIFTQSYGVFVRCIL